MRESCNDSLRDTGETRGELNSGILGCRMHFWERWVDYIVVAVLCFFFGGGHTLVWTFTEMFI